MMKKITNRSTTSITTKDARGRTLGRELMDGCDAKDVTERFAHFPAQALDVLIAGLSNLRSMKTRERASVARTFLAQADWCYEHPAATERQYQRAMLAVDRKVKPSAVK